MPLFVNPFKKHDVKDFPGILVSLQDAPRHPSVLRGYEERAGGRNSTFDPDAEKGQSPSRDENSPYTIEGLKLEVEEDLAAAAHDTTYDRMCCKPLFALSPEWTSIPASDR